MVQWLRLYTSTAGGMGSNPGWGAKILSATGCGKKNNNNKRKKINHQAQPEALISEFRNNQLKAQMVQGLSWEKQMLSLSLSLSLSLFAV